MSNKEILWAVNFIRPLETIMVAFAYLPTRFKVYLCFVDMPEFARLRSALWSSETLADGAAALTDQPTGFLVKNEDDKDMADQFAASCFNSLPMVNF